MKRTDKHSYYVFHDLKANCVKLYYTRKQLHRAQKICYETLTYIFCRLGRDVYTKDDFRIYRVPIEPDTA